jgi:RNA polymerase sigma-70 factor (ECF subfamily)
MIMAVLTGLVYASGSSAFPFFQYGRLRLMGLDITAVYLAHRSELVNHLSRIVLCRETAQDIVQESYLVLANTSADCSVEQPRAFLYRIATNLAWP